jgi:8-amino-7-oxononanoate synthase
LYLLPVHPTLHVQQETNKDHLSQRRESLQRNIAHFYRHLDAHPQWSEAHRSGTLRVPLLRDWEIRPFQTPIVTLYTRDGASTSLAGALGGQKYRVQQGGYPFVARGSEGIRVMIHAGNTEGEVEGLVEAIMQWCAGCLKAADGSWRGCKL